MKGAGDSPCSDLLAALLGNIDEIEHMNDQAGGTDKPARITKADLHSHLRARMLQRGVMLQEIQRVLDSGWDASDAKPGVLGKVMVFPYQSEWEGKTYEEKEVTVYYRIVDGDLVILTAKARYGRDFPRGE
jgi:hypothetical protein